MDWNKVEAVGTWFAGIATAGSLWLGFTILRSDRKREERSQADKIDIYSQSHWGVDDVKQVDVRVWNHSDQPIFNTHLHGVLSSGDALSFRSKRALNDKQLLGLILPGDSAKLHLKSMNRISTDQLYVTFSDANRVDWKYQVGSRQLSKWQDNGALVVELETGEYRHPD
jgi:hypothetical protein